MRKGLDILKRFGAVDIKPYTLVSNYGYTFTLNGFYSFTDGPLIWYIDREEED